MQNCHFARRRWPRSPCCRPARCGRWPSTLSATPSRRAARNGRAKTTRSWCGTRPRSPSRRSKASSPSRHGTGDSCWPPRAGSPSTPTRTCSPRRTTRKAGISLLRRQCARGPSGCTGGRSSTACEDSRWITAASGRLCAAILARRLPWCGRRPRCRFSTGRRWRGERRSPWPRRTRSSRQACPRPRRSCAGRLPSTRGSVPAPCTTS